MSDGREDIFVSDGKLMHFQCLEKALQQQRTLYETTNMLFEKLVQHFQNIL